MSSAPATGVAVTDQATRERLAAAVEFALAEAKKSGASAAEAGANISQGLAVTVRLGEVETVEHTRDKGLGLTVYFGQRSGSASTTDISPEALRDTVRAACAIAKHTAEDDCAGLPDAALLARKPMNLDLFHPWDLSVEQAIDTAALMLGSDKSRGYCLEMICADFLAGANLDNGDPNVLLNSILRFFKFLPGQHQQAFLNCLRQKVGA